METPDRRARISDFKSLLLKSLFIERYLSDNHRRRITSRSPILNIVPSKRDAKYVIIQQKSKLFSYFFTFTGSTFATKGAKRHLRLAK